MKLFGLEVWGNYACFTRPKVERHSYPVITPSAARAIFNAIYLHFGGGSPCRASFRWQVRRVEIVNPVQFIPFSRNEIKGKISTALVLRSAKNPALLKSLLADASGSKAIKSGRTQRQATILRNVRYRIYAEPVLFTANVALERQIERVFERRVENGQCYHQPYFGCREFVAYFEPIDPLSTTRAAVDEEIGWMIYDVFDLSTPGSPTDATRVSIFKASIRDGVLEIPPFESGDVRKLGLVVF